MDINNNTNISSQIASSISKLNLSSQKRAFENTIKSQNEQNEDFFVEDVKLIDKNKVEKAKKNEIDVNDIQKYANLMGENLSIDDINYALMYGRSVIADYSA